MGCAKRKGVFERAQNAQIQSHPTHAQSLIRIFALHPYILLCSIQLADSEGPDKNARMRRLIWAFAVSICSKICFRMKAHKVTTVIHVCRICPLLGRGRSGGGSGVLNFAVFKSANQLYSLFMSLVRV